MTNEDKALNILALQLGHNATALLAKDGRVAGCVSQERFDNIKNSSAFPRDPILWLLDQHGVAPSAVDRVAICGLNIAPNQLQHLDVEYNTAPNAIQQLRTSMAHAYGWLSYHMGHSWLMQLLEAFKKKPLFKQVAHSKTRLAQDFKHMGITAPIEYVEHHACHTYSPIYALGAGAEPTLVFAMDGSGDEYFATISIAENGQVRTIAASPWCHSLGYVYSKTTQFMGMKPLEHEYKVMGLAAYAKEPYFQKTYDRVFKGVVDLDPSNPLQFQSRFPMNRFDWHLRAAAVGERFDNLAGALQYFLEDLVLRWVHAAVEQTGIRRIMTSGGVFMNVKLNKRIQEMPNVDEAFFMPSCGDESNPFGAAAYVAAQAGKPLAPLPNIYLGHAYSNQDVQDFIRNKRLDEMYDVTFHEDINTAMAQMLADFEVIARVAGAAEFGARSLGNRAILANPSDLQSFYLVNDQIKARDFWMPFAPSILDTDMDRYVENPKNISAPYMITAFDTTPLGQQHLRAAMHQGDKTVRPQTVTPAANPAYYDLLQKFKACTGIGGLMNTSFNLHGYPLANTLDQALFTFENSGLQHLALENFIISKRC